MKTNLLASLWLSFLSLGLPTAGRAQLFYVSLDKAAIVLPARTLYVEQVLDARPNRAGIGMVHRGLANIPQQADLQPAVVPALTTLLQAQLPQRPADHPVALVVRRLQLSEEITVFSEKARLDLSVDVFAHLADGYHYVLSATELVESKGLETTAHHANNLALALQRCLAQCQTLKWEQLPTQPALTLAGLQQLGRPAASAPTYAILTDLVRPKGYYPTFLAFRNNQPVTTPALQLETSPRKAKGWEGTVEVVPYLPVASGARPERLPKAWGFCDGKQAYILHDGHYLPLTPVGTSFQFTGFTRADPGAVSTAGFLGGMVGGAIAGAATSGKPLALTLDMVTGAVSPFADAGRAPATRDTVSFYVYRLRSKTSGPLRLLLNGQFVGELADNTFLTLPWTDREHEPHLRLEGAPGPELTFIPSFQREVYIKVLTPPGADLTKPALEQVPTKEGEFDVRAIRLRQQVELKKQRRTQP